MNALEVGIVRCHAVVLQAGDGLHTLLRHVLLGQYDGHLLGAVVTEVDEDDDVTLLDAAVDAGVVDRLDELISHALVIAFLHSLHHIGSLLASTVDNQVIALLHTLPALVAVHCIETAHDAGDSGIIVGADLSNLLDEALTTLGVCVATIHVTMYKELVLQTVCLTNLN